jgi:thioredoxin-related protein
LPQAAGQAAVRGEPLVLLVSLPGCPYCELVRRNYLLPAQRGSLHAWQLNVADTSTPLVGFDGRVTSAAAQTKAWKATFTPTVLFLGPQGQALAEPLVGAAIPDFYGAYLDERLVLARRAVVGLR